MSYKDFLYLKETLEKGAYGDISFSENEKRNVLMNFPERKKQLKGSL
jgi:hypothetical protein